MVGESIPAFLSLTEGLTRVRCECCGFTGNDPVAHLLVAEAVLVSLREAKRVEEAQAEVDREAWEQARAQLEAARGGR
jgi:hypothetical protein